MDTCTVDTVEPGYESRYRCEDVPIAAIAFACPHEHVDIVRACSGCAVEVQHSAGGLICPRCDSNAERSHECLMAVTITWDDGTVTRVQDTEGRNLL